MKRAAGRVPPPLVTLALLAALAAPVVEAQDGAQDGAPAPLPTPSAAAAAAEPAESPALGRSTALREGNRLFEAGQLDAALAAYRAGYRGDAAHPTLVYNLATTLHHLDRLPEAILWYRRGDADDPWLEENLWLARRSLGSQRLDAGGVAALVSAGAGWLFAAAVAASCLSLLVALFGRGPRSAWAIPFGLALVLSLASLAAERYGPREAVLLERCATAAGELPAGSEIWLWPASGDPLAVAGFAGAECPSEAVGWIEVDPP